LPGDHVDVLLTRTDKGNTLTDVVAQNVRVMAIDQSADERADKPSVVRAVTLEVNVLDGQKLALAGTAGTLSLLLRKAGELSDEASHRITLTDIGRPFDASQGRFVSVQVNRPMKDERIDYSVPVEGSAQPSAGLQHVSGTRDQSGQKQADLNRRGE
jgi:pilus assembly protein CpaB